MTEKPSKSHDKIVLKEIFHVWCCHSFEVWWLHIKMEEGWYCLFRDENKVTTLKKITFYIFEASL